MQLYRKNNIIINATKHKGTIQEKTFTHRDTRIGRRTGKNPLRGKPFQILLLIRFSLNDLAKESTMIHIFNHTTIPQKQLNNIHEMNPTIPIIKTLIQKPVINCHYLR